MSLERFTETQRLGLSHPQYQIDSDKVIEQVSTLMLSILPFSYQYQRAGAVRYELVCVWGKGLQCPAVMAGCSSA